jgi:hypothetical protein
MFETLLTLSDLYRVELEMGISDLHWKDRAGFREEWEGKLRHKLKEGVLRLSIGNRAVQGGFDESDFLDQEKMTTTYRISGSRSRVGGSTARGGRGGGGLVQKYANLPVPTTSRGLAEIRAAAAEIVRRINVGAWAGGDDEEEMEEDEDYVEDDGDYDDD